MLSYSVREPYWNAFRYKAHTLIGKGYEGALCKIRKKEWKENEVTGFLVQEIDALLTGELNFTLQYVNFQVEEQRPVNRSEKYGSDRQLIDIVIRCPQQRKRVAVFAFEAKRLRTGGFPIGNYTGKEGMGCFLNDEYAERMPEAAMVAYFQNESVLYWEMQLRSQLTSPVETFTVVSSLPVEFKTKHVRQSGNQITLYHIFLDCCPGV